MTLMRSAISLCLLFTVIRLPGGAWPRYATPMKLELRIPEKHPYLALTPAKIERAAKRAAASPWARQQTDQILAQANGFIAQPWNQLPPKGDLVHRAIGGRLFTVALAYAFSGDSAYEGIRLRRAVRLVDSSVVDAFTVMDRKAAEHQYDYVLHIDGQLENSSIPLAPKLGKLGETSGYQLVEERQRGTAKAPFSLTFASEGMQLRLWVPGQDATEVIVADGLTNSPDRKMPMLVLRRKASHTRFVTVLEPVSAQYAIRAVRTEGGDIVIESTRGTRRLRDAL